MKKRSLIFYFCLFTLFSCGDSKLDRHFDNVNNTPSPSSISAVPANLSGVIDVSAANGSPLNFPTLIWQEASQGTHEIDFYEVSVALDDGNNLCDENDFLATLTLNWTKVPSGTDFSGTGYQIDQGDSDGNAQSINVSWLGDTNYCVAIRAVDMKGNQSPVIYSSSPINFQYKSCKEKKDNEPSAADGIYSIDVDRNGPKTSFDVYCDMSTNGGGWTLLLNQNPIIGNLFSSLIQAQNFNEADPTNNLYSIINKTADFLRDGEYEFYQSWPGTVCAATPHHWTQTSTPHLTNNVTGYTSISTPTNTGGGGFNGLCQSSSVNALLSSNCGTGNWWYAVGATAVYAGSGTPGCGQVVSHVQLWVR